MSLRQTSPLRKIPFLGRSVLPHGEKGAAIGVPADVREELDLQPGEDGDLVDLQYDRDEASLTIYFDREVLDDDELEELRDRADDVDRR